MHALKTLALLLAVTGTIAVPGSALAAPPGNDDFATALLLTGPVLETTGSNEEATKETGEPNHAGDTGGSSVWYAWTSPAAGELTISTCGSTFDTLLAVYTGPDVATLQEVAANDDECGQQSRVSFETRENVAYRIAVDGAAAAVGEIAFAIRLAPPNNDFDRAQTLTGESGNVSSSNVGASTEEDEPEHAGSGFASVWYRWTSAADGPAMFDTCGGHTFDTVVAVYTGDAVDRLTEIRSSDDAGCGMGSRVVFAATAGTVYSIVVAGYEGGTGDFTLSWNRTPPPILEASPQITGTARDGETLTASEGQWSAAPPVTYAYSWGRCDRYIEECELIEGATSRTIVVRSVDIGYRLFVRVTASNPHGSSRAFSDVTDVVVARPPSNTTAPTVTGEAKLGAILVAAPGAWAGTPPLSLAYQWQSCDPINLDCKDLVGQTGQVMQVTNLELGSRIRIVVTATNVVGSASMPSEPTAVVPRPQVRRCVVPNVRGKTLRAARAVITRNACRVGRTRRVFSNRMRAGRVLSQSPRPGARLLQGGKVNLVLSRGRKR